MAKHWNTIVLSGDSRQFYKETSIGTAKPSVAEQDGIRHYFVDSHSIHAPLTSAQFEQEALEILEKLFKDHDHILLVGGSGMFIDALCHGLDEIPNQPEVREILTREYQTAGLGPLLEELEAKDPEFFAQVDKQNPVRIIRALEVIRISGKPFSSFRASAFRQRPFAVQKFVIDLPREILYERINRRVDIMMQQGLLQEVESLHAFRNLQTLNTVGYSELFDHLEGKTTLAEAIELIKRNTRRYAKRQLTWFRRDENALWISETDPEKQITFVLENV